MNGANERPTGDLPSAFVPGGMRRTTWAALLIAGAIIVPFVVQADDQPAMLGWAAIGMASLAIVAGFGLLWQRPSVLVGFILAWLAIQKLLVAIVTPYVSQNSALWLLNVKEVMGLALPFVGALVLGAGTVRALQSGQRKLQIRPGIADLCAIGFITLVALAFLFGDASFSERIVYARRLALAPIMFLAGRLLWGSRLALIDAARYLVVIGVSIAVFGLIERLVLGEGFWRDTIHINSYFVMSVDVGLLPESARLANGLLANWSTYIGGMRVTRLVSSFLEPTTLSLALASVLILIPAVTAASRWRRSLAVVVVALAMLLTWGKGGWLAFALALVLLVLGTSRTTFIRDVILAGAVGLAALVIGLLLPLNIPAHLKDLASGLEAMLSRPLGIGLGTTGYWGLDSQIGGDSTIGGIASQLGWPGLVVWSAWMLGTVWTLLPAGPRRVWRPTVERALAGSVFGLFIVGWVSNSTTGLLAFAPAMILAGWAVSAASRAEWSARQPPPRGLVLGWMPVSRRGASLAAALDADLMLLARRGYRKPWTASLSYPILALRTIRTLLDLRPAWVLVVAPPVVAPLVVAPIAALLGIRWAIDIHTGALLDKRWRWSAGLLRRLVDMAGAGVVTLDSLAKVLNARGGEVFVIPDPLPPIRPDPVEVPDADRPLVVSVCGWGDDEPIRELIEAARGQPYDLVLTGRPRFPVDLPDNIHLSGFLDDREYVNLLARCDAVVVLTTRDHTLLSGIWEALALGKAVVTSATPTLRETFGEGLMLVGPRAQDIRVGVDRTLARLMLATERAREVGRDFRIRNDEALTSLRGWLAPPHAGSDAKRPIGGDQYAR